MTRPGDRFVADAVEQRLAALLDRQTRRLLWFLLPLYGVFLAMTLAPVLMARW